LEQAELVEVALAQPQQVLEADNQEHKAEIQYSV
jgi:hypothetical protein